MAENEKKYTHNSSIKISNNFEVTTTKPLDVRLVVDKYENLFDGTIKAPYKGMVVNIAGTRDLYVLKDDGINCVNNEDIINQSNWCKVSDIEVVNNDFIKNLDNGNEDEIKKQITNPQDGLIVSIENTNELYILTNSKNYTNPENWLKIGGISEDSIPIFLSKDTAKIISDNVHNKFNYNENALNSSDYFIFLDKSKNNDSFLSHCFEMVTTEMLDDLSYSSSIELENIRQLLSNKIDILENSIYSKINNIEEDFFENLKNIDEFYDNEVVRIDNKIDNIYSLLNDNINILSNSVDTEIDSLKEKDIELSEDIELSKIYISEGNNGDNKDIWQTVEVGGIADGTKPSAFENKTISEVLDMILYPTLQPEVKPQPYTQISIKPIIYKANVDKIPEKSAFNRITNRGEVTYNNSDGNRYYAGIKTSNDNDNTTINRGGFGEIFEEKSYTITFSATFDPGAQPLDNKGNTATSITPFPGGVKSSNTTIYGVHPIYINTPISNETTISDITVEQELKNYLVGGNVTVDTNGEISTIRNATEWVISVNAETKENKFTLEIPESLNLVAVRQLNDNNGHYDINIDSILLNPDNDLSSTIEPDNNKYHIKYIRYVRSNSPTNYLGPTKYQIVVTYKS